MAHKQKGKKLTEQEMEAKKTQHYKNKGELMQALAGERKKEQALTGQLNKIKLMLNNVRDVFKFINKHPTKDILYVYGKAVVPLNNAEARDQLVQDQKEFEKQVETVKKQIQFAAEKQLEFENRLKRMPTFPETLNDTT